MTQKLKPLSKSKRNKKKLSPSHQSELSTEKERTLSKLTHTDKPPLKENSLTLMIQKLKLLSRSKKSKKKLSPSHPSEPSTEKERTLSKPEAHSITLTNQNLKLLSTSKLNKRQPSLCPQ